jgi:hypothetical protein
MSTLQDVVSLARIDLNDATTNPSSGDAVTPRYPDADLLKFANNGIAKALVMRQDLNFGNYANAYTDLTLTDAFPLPIEYRPAISAYVVACNQSGDDEFVLQQRAEKSMQDFMRNLGMG